MIRRSSQKRAESLERGTECPIEAGEFRTKDSLRAGLDYGVAVVAIGLATLLRHLLQPALGDQQPFSVFYPAVLFVAWYGGVGPAVLAIVLGLLVGTWFFVEPVHSVLIARPADLWGLVVYVFVGIVTTLISDAQRRAQARAQTSARALIESEASVRRSQELLRTTLRSIGDAVVATDAQARVTFINRVAESLTGWKEDAAVGRPCAEVLEVLDAQSQLAGEHPVQLVLGERDAEMGGENVLRSRDGSERPIERTVTPISSEAGATLGAVLVFRDISGRREAERERTHLLEAERLARSAAEQARDRLRFLAEASRVLSASLEPLTTLDRVAQLVVPLLADWCDVRVVSDSGKIERVAVACVDPAMEALTHELDQRYPLAIDVPWGVSNVLRSGRTEVYPEISDEMLVDGAHDEEHLRILRDLGIRSALLTPLIARGRTLGVVTFLFTRSGRQYAAEDQELAEDLARRAATAIDNGRLYTEAQSALYASREAVEQHERTEEKLALLAEATSALIGSLTMASVLQGVLALSHRLVSADAYAVWRSDAQTGRWCAVCSNGLSDSFEAAIERQDAQIMPDRWLVLEDIAVDPLMKVRSAALSAEGVRSMLVIPLHIRQNISGTLVFYYRRQHLFAGTELKVAGALANIAASAISTAELYEALSSRAEELMDADRMKDEFMAMLAHELRNPLAAVSNAVEVMELAPPSALSFQRSRDVVARQTRHMSRLVDELLDVSRISRGKIRLQRERVDLSVLVRTTCDDHQQTLDSAGLSLAIEVPSHPLWVEGDPTRLRQILGNLLQNAAKFTDTGGAVTVSVVMESSWHVIAVSDTGIGIEPKMLHTVFEAFTQGDRGLDRTQGGLGLGLALVKSIVDLHRGTVKAESDGIGKGARFVIRLPAAASRASDLLAEDRGRGSSTA